ncbi:hypothetical protein ACN6AT_06155 [Streptomyces sp. JL4002]
MTTSTRINTWLVPALRPAARCSRTAHRPGKDQRMTAHPRLPRGTDG